MAGCVSLGELHTEMSLSREERVGYRTPHPLTLARYHSLKRHDRQIMLETSSADHCRLASDAARAKNG